MNNNIIYILQVACVYNAIVLGWDVRKIGENKYELRKKSVNGEKIVLRELVNEIVSG